MEGPNQESSDLWLFNFRQKINSSCSPLEFARNALLFDPYHPNRNESSSFQGLETKETQQSFRTEFKCSGVTVMDVASVFTSGKNSFISCSDVKINLYKVFIYLSEALRRLKSTGNFVNNDTISEYNLYLSTLNFLLNRFNDYIKISMNLSENPVLTPLKDDYRSEPGNESNMQKNTKFSEITSRFKVNQDEMRRMFKFDADDPSSTDSSYYSSETTSLLWSFYRDANCSDIFALLCYTLFTGNTFAYKSLLENFSPCMKSHVRENWKVLLSYVSISFEFKDYQYTFESILFERMDDDEWNFEVGSVNEELLVSFIDWCLWRIFLIIKYTNSSYFLLIKFLKNLFKLFGPFESLPRVNAKFQVLNFLKFIIKQYFIYKSFNSNNVYKDRLSNNNTKNNYSNNYNNTYSNNNYNTHNNKVEGLEVNLTDNSSNTNYYMSFFEYLDLDASKKLSLFCEFDVSGTYEECSCPEEFKDKHKIYKYCLQCKTNNLCNKLKSFFVLISPAGDPAHSDDESSSYHFQFQKNLDRDKQLDTKSDRGDSPNELELDPLRDQNSNLNNQNDNFNDQHNLNNENNNSNYNEYLSVDGDFRNFYGSLLKSYNSGLNDYISGIAETFMKELNVHSFEILYSLSLVLLETGFRNKVFNIFINTIYTNKCRYNFLENYFLIKSTFNLILSNSDLDSPGNKLDTSNTLFRLLRYFDTSKLKNTKGNNSYSSYRLLSTLLNNLNYNTYNNNNNNTNDNNEDHYNNTNDNDHNITKEVVVCSMHCQLDFVESLLNLLSLMSVESPNSLEITPLELILALVNEEYFLVMLQKILLFIVDLSLVQNEFSNCLLELINLSSYLSFTDHNTIYKMFFYTIASRNNLNYLNQQLHLWFHSFSNEGSVDKVGNFGNESMGLEDTDRMRVNEFTKSDETNTTTTITNNNSVSNSSSTNKTSTTTQNNNENENTFLESSLDCVLNSVHRMDLSCGINLFQLLVSYCNYVPQNNKFYSTVSLTNPLSIYSVISLYLNYNNTDNNDNNSNNNDLNNNEVEVVKSNLTNYSSSKENKHNQTLSKLDMLITLSKVYKCMLIFDSYNLVNYKGHENLEYKLYNHGQLVDLTLSTLISVVDSNYLHFNRLLLTNKSCVGISNTDSNSSSTNKTSTTTQSSKAVEYLGKKERMLVLVFRCILEHVLVNKLYTLDFFNNLKIAIGELCPKQVSFVLFNIVDVLTNLNDQSSLQSVDYLKSDGPDEKLNGLLVNLLFILFYQSYNFLFMSNLLQYCVSSQLSTSVKFLYKHLMNLNPENIQYDYNTNTYISGSNSSSTNKTSTTTQNNNENENSDDERLEIEMGELFNYSNEVEIDPLRDQNNNNGYDDNDFRRNVLMLLDPNRSEKTKSWSSIGNLANKFGHNVASDFISAAIEKAEGELLNIAKKSQKFDLLKDKLFYQKKEQSDQKSMYAPVMNYFNSTPLYPVNFNENEVGNENMYLNELLQYRNLKEINVASMVSVNVELACQMLMENCSYTCNSVFLQEIQEVFNRNDFRRVYEFIEVLLPYLEYSKWSPGVLEKVEAVKGFLSLFLGFPENVTVLVSSFVYNREYRLTLFKNIPSFLASNLQLVQKIYKNLGVFYDFDNFKEAVVVSPETTENLEEYLFGPITVSTTNTTGTNSSSKDGVSNSSSTNKTGTTTQNNNTNYDYQVNEVEVGMYKDNNNEYNNIVTNSFVNDSNDFSNGSNVEFDYMDEYVEVLFSVYEEIFLDDFNIESFLELEPLFLLNHEKYLYFLLKLYYSLTFNNGIYNNTNYNNTYNTYCNNYSNQSNYNNTSTTTQNNNNNNNNMSSPTSIHSSFSITSHSLHSLSAHTPRTTTSRSSGVSIELNNSRLVMIRRCIYNFLQVYPDLKDSFSMLYKAESLDVLKLLETVLSNVPDFDLTVVDNFELFKQSLMSYLNLNNFFFVAESFEKLDPSFSVAIYSKLELKLRPHSDELVDCTRMLFEYDLSNSTL